MADRTTENLYDARDPPDTNSLYDRANTRPRQARSRQRREGRALVQADGVQLKQNPQAALVALDPWGL
jgi:hypothetical protein